VYDKNAAVTAANIYPAVLDIYGGGTAKPEAIVCFGSFAVHALPHQHAVIILISFKSYTSGL
jgi:hypothetical protein